MPHNCIVYAIYILQFFVILLLLVLTEITLILVVHIFHDKVGQKQLGVTMCLLFGCFFSLCLFSTSSSFSYRSHHVEKQFQTIPNKNESIAGLYSVKKQHMLFQTFFSILVSFMLILTPASHSVVV